MGDQNSLNYQDRNDYDWTDYQVIDVTTWEVDLGVCVSDIRVHITKGYRVPTIWAQTIKLCLGIR